MQRSYTDQSQSPIYAQSPFTHQYSSLPPMHLQTRLAQNQVQPASHTMGPYRPGVNLPMVHSANMTSMTNSRPQLSVRDGMGEHEEMRIDPHILYTPEYSTIYSRSSSNPSTVRSVSRNNWTVIRQARIWLR